MFAPRAWAVARTLVAAIWPARPMLGQEWTDRNGTLHADDWNKLHFLYGKICEKCGTDMDSSVGYAPICGPCLVRRSPIDIGRAALVYDDASRPLILGLKHANRQDGMATFANWMKRALPLADMAGAEWSIVPVPSHWTRVLKRGFNPAARLAQALGGILPIAAYRPLWLKRQKATPYQKGRTRVGRWRNVAHAFAVPTHYRAKVQGANILLVDDVHTTGATLTAAAKCLKRAGAARVYALSLARVVRLEDVAL